MYRHLHLLVMIYMILLGCFSSSEPRMDQPEPCSGNDCIAPVDPCDETRFGQVCEGGGICAVVDPCGGPVECYDGGCPDVCVPLWGCMEPTPDGSACSYDEGTCNIGSRCRPESDDCELVDCDPSNGSCTQGCQIQAMTCQPTLSGDSCDTLVCRRGEVCVEETMSACDDDPMCSTSMTRATCVVDKLPREEWCLGGRNTCGYGEVCAPDIYRMAQYGNYGPYYETPWLCQPSRLNACSTVNCPDDYTCMEAVGPDGEVACEGKACDIVENIERPICVAQRVASNCDPDADNVCGAEELCLVDKSAACRKLYRDRTPDGQYFGACLEEFTCQTEANDCRYEGALCASGKTCQIVGCEGDCDADDRCTGDECTDVFACEEVTTGLSVGYECDPAKVQCGDGLACRPNGGTCSPTDCPNGEPGCATRDMRYVCHPITDGDTCDDVNCRINEICEVNATTGRAECVTQFSIGDCDPSIPDACADGSVCLPDYVIPECTGGCGRDAACSIPYRCQIRN